MVNTSIIRYDSLIILLNTAILCVACTSQPTIVKQIEFQEVKVPVIVKPAPPPLIERPSLPIESLTSQDPPGIVAQKYKASIKVLQGYAKQLEQILKGYQ